MKKGLIMEGGAMRGMFTAGVIDVLMENKIIFDGAIGVSAGAAFGSNIKSGQIGRAIRYNLKYCRDKRYCSLYSLFKTGNLYGADFCYRILPTKLDIFDTKSFNKNPMEFYAVCTDVLTGKPVYKKIDAKEENYLEWFRASASMPLVSEIVKIGDLSLLDGGISDSVPLRYFENIGYNKNVVILTQPASYIKSKNKLMPIIRRVYRKYPDFVKAMGNRHNVYNETIKYICEKEKSGEIFVIRPDTALPVRKIEKNQQNLRYVYELGRRAATQNLKKLIEFLA